MRAMLIWDGGDTVNVPPSMGVACDDQLTGTVGEQLIETACRLCYDSLGTDKDGKRKGRATPETLQVILDHRHHSVLEHFVLTVQLSTDHLNAHRLLTIYGTLLNRRGVWTRTTARGLRVTINARAVIEWDAWSERIRGENGFVRGGQEDVVASHLGSKIRDLFAFQLPLIVTSPEVAPDPSHWMWGVGANMSDPRTDHEQHVTLYLQGSRGFSHEQVRHRFAISQRSTRFTDENESPWDWHPLLEEHCEQAAADELHGQILEFVDESKSVYKNIVEDLQGALLQRMVPKGKATQSQKRMARKQARGAARGFLGNALRTDMAFTASVADWRHVMIAQRGHDAADAEIRRIYMGDVSDPDDCVLGALLTSRYASSFADLDRVVSEDGTSLALA